MRGVFAKLQLILNISHAILSISLLYYILFQVNWPVKIHGISGLYELAEHQDKEMSVANLISFCFKLKCNPAIKSVMYSANSNTIMVFERIPFANLNQNGEFVIDENGDIITYGKVAKYITLTGDYSKTEINNFRRFYSKTASFIKIASVHRANLAEWAITLASGTKILAPNLRKLAGRLEKLASKHNIDKYKYIDFYNADKIILFLDSN